MEIQPPPTNKGLDSQAEKIQRVMIVDDHEVFRYGLSKLLAESESFRIIADASNYEDAFIRLQSVSIDLVLLDLHLPDVDGIEALHQLKHRSPAPDVIIISATIDDDTLLDALLAGASGYLTKDTPAFEMLNALKAYQRGEMALSSAMASHAIFLLVQHYSMLESELTTYRQNQIQALRQQTPDIVIPPVSSIPQQTRNPPPVLTPQEEKVYQGMRRGWSNKQIAAELYISRFTVGKHVQNILRKLRVTNRTQAVSYTLFEGDEEIEAQ
ncbi:MAG TPA: response regulator transcription factor [Ktedonobacteraceae bacterium]|nr:response regulator transcription factor [Ktedonobacteraceae bacterium]